MMYRSAFDAHLKATTLSGSNKRTSYLRGIDLLERMLAAHAFGFDDCKNVWQVGSIERLHALQQRVREEQQQGDKSVWNLDDLPKSYLQNGYCSAALTSYLGFLVEFKNCEGLLSAFEAHTGSEDEVVAKFDQPFDYPDILLNGLTAAEGKDVVRDSKVRVNQHVFRKIILKIYNQTCCLTGIDIPEVNRASHIVPWAEETTIRLDPRNGLCLSGTYDLAFDRHLITLDDDFRLILSKTLKEHYSSESFRNYFLKIEGKRIILPKAYLPSQEHLDCHRKAGDF